MKDRLHQIISNQTVLSYSQVWEELKDVDEDTQDTSSVRLLYSGTTSPKSDNGTGTDLHHLRPTDVTVNSARGNLDFDNGGSENSEAPATTPTVTRGSRAAARAMSPG